jgi:hypothetical protein
VARIAQRINDRLHAASEQLAERAAAAPEITSYRTEHDSLGEREIPNSAYYGVQTVRALENFAISGIPAAELRALHQRARLRQEGGRDGECGAEMPRSRHRRCDR